MDEFRDTESDIIGGMIELGDKQYLTVSSGEYYVTERIKDKSRWKGSRTEAKKLRTGKCEICGRYTTKRQVDHCHRTGKIRGMLCRECNLGLGHFLDRPSVLRRAADYLESHSPGRLDK